MRWMVRETSIFLYIAVDGCSGLFNLHIFWHSPFLVKSQACQLSGESSWAVESDITVYANLVNENPFPEMEKYIIFRENLKNSKYRLVQRIVYTVTFECEIVL